MKDKIHELGRLTACLTCLTGRVEAAKHEAEGRYNQPDNIIERLAVVQLAIHQAANELLSISRDIDDQQG
jgi:hypothetical protein